MLRRNVLWLLVSLAAISGSVSRAQDGELPPAIDVVRWDVLRDGALFFPVFDASSSDPALNDIGNIPDFLHQELDIVRVVVQLDDPDWVVDPNNTTEFEEAFLRFLALPVTFYEPPNVPPIADASNEFFGPFAPPDGSTNTFVNVTIFFGVPEFLGRNQLRLRGLIDFDVEYTLVFSASNEEEPAISAEFFLGCGQPEPPITCELLTFHVIEKPGLGQPNPRPIADAGADRTFATGATVTLDASRTFDGSNTGFDSGDDLNIFDKDTLTFAWEWISGPVRVDPVQTSADDPTATVVLTTLGTYTYRVTVDDNVNSLPSQDTVEITIVQTLPTNSPPRASVTGPASSIILGATITLDASASSDPDGDTLTFRWRQVDELGRAIDSDQIEEVFQPASGVTGNRLTWQAVTTGTFYFELTVSDGEFSASVPFQVTVIDPTVSGIVVDLTSGVRQISGNDTGSDDVGGDAASDTGSRAPGACGTGLLPAALAPLALLLMRRSRR